ncbi:hypothetical protein Q8F55_001421 [Vanrija albida]|uniref:Uncharacterized protein n=1 Tax=Vanrija albida TaxID=181172 RepID=A0ABR3QGU3_9TREE
MAAAAHPPPLKRVTQTGVWGELVWQTEPAREPAPPPVPPRPVVRRRAPPPQPPRRKTRPPIVSIEEEAPPPVPPPPRPAHRAPPPRPAHSPPPRPAHRPLPPLPTAVQQAHVVRTARPRLVSLKRRDQEPLHRPAPRPPPLSVTRDDVPPLVADTPTPPRSASPASSDGGPQTPPTPTLPSLWFLPLPMPPSMAPDAPTAVDDDWGLGAHFALLKSG